MKVRRDDSLACDARRAEIRVDLLGDAVPAIDERLRFGLGQAAVGCCEDWEGEDENWQ